MVEWKKLGEVCDILNGFAFKSQHYTPQGVRIIRISDVQSGYISSKDMVFYPFEKLPEYERYLLKEGDIVMSLTGNPGRIAIIPNDNCALNQRVACLRPKDVNISFIYYLFNCKEFENIAFANSTGGAQKNLSTTWLKGYSIPIPSLAEQTRIVGILDTFTSSIDNLKQQIAQRRKQYEYYRDQLLDLKGKEGVEMMKLEDIVSKECSLSYGIVQPGDDVLEGIPVVRPIDLTTTYVSRQSLKNTTKDISDSYKRTILKGDEILFCVRGTTGIMSLATPELVGCNVTRGIVPISFDNEITKFFVYYQLKSRKQQKIIADKTNGTALKQINIKDLRQINILIPSLSEQQRIVDILDKFEASIQNLESQLSQREKQYEYYRNKLLTFE